MEIFIFLFLDKYNSSWVNEAKAANWI